MILRRVCLGLLLVGLITTAAWARNGVVRTKDGRSFEGEITDKGIDGVMVATKGGTITLRRDDVAQVDYAADIKEAYKKRLASLPAGAGAKEHFEIARWLFDAKAYELAREEVNTVLQLDPNSAEATLLRRTIDRQMAWEASGRSGVEPKPADPAQARSVAGTIRERRYLNAEQINEIRLCELREDERPVRVRLDGDVKKRFTDYNNIDPRAFAAMNDFQKALRILKEGTAEMRKDVKLLSDPVSLAEFKARIQPIVLNGCATANCHGGLNAGRFQLYSPAENEAATYTNFYILTQTTATVGDTRYKLIDRVHPNNSLLAQFALPRDRAELDHPECQGWTAYLRGYDDTKYGIQMEWIRNTLLAIEPKYDINFVLPGAGVPTTQPVRPATEPAPAAAQPQPRQDVRPQAQPQPQQPARANPPAGSGGAGDMKDKLDEMRGRIRPYGL